MTSRWLVVMNADPSQSRTFRRSDALDMDGLGNSVGNLSIMDVRPQTGCKSAVRNSSLLPRGQYTS